MGEKLVITVRFNPEGTEAELYRKIQLGKQTAGLSTPECIKAVLSGYFDSMHKKDEEQGVLQEIRAECVMIEERLEKAIKQGQQEQEVNLGRLISTLACNMPITQENIPDSGKEARLPDVSREIPQGALDFLDRF